MYILESLGAFTKLREEYPEKTYLNYLGENRIDISVSRKAKNFELLRVWTAMPLAPCSNPFAKTKYSFAILLSSETLGLLLLSLSQSHQICKYK